MKSIVDVIQLADFPAILFLWGFLTLAGFLFMGSSEKITALSRWCGGVAFFLYIVPAFVYYPPENVWYGVSIAVRAFLAAGLVCGIAHVVIPFLFFAYQWGRQAADSKRPEPIAPYTITAPPRLPPPPQPSKIEQVQRLKEELEEKKAAIRLLLSDPEEIEIIDKELERSMLRKAQQIIE